MTLKRSRALTALTLLLALLVELAPPAHAENVRKTLLASGAQTAAGQGGTIDVSACRIVYPFVSVTAGSGTVTTFKVYLEGSPDGGLTWSGLHCWHQSKRVTTGPVTTFLATAGSGEGLIVNETAVVSSATTYAGSCDVTTDTVRLGWEISGTTPSETFSAQLVCK